MYNYNRDLIYFIKREGTTQNPYNNITENIHVLYEKAFLEEVPVQAFKVVAKVGNTTLTEVNREQDIKTTNHYYVNYKQGIVYFHSTKNNELVTLTYRGQGVLLYPASRIYIDSEFGAKDVVKTLRDLIIEGAGALDAVQQVAIIISRAETAIAQANTIITNANNAIALINDKITEVNTAEANRLLAEDTRRTNEDSRLSAELARVNVEVARVASETARNNAEIDRANAESNRDVKEAERQTKEAERNTAEIARNTKETARNTAETARANAELTRVNAETARNTSETNRNTRETERNSRENERIANENARISKENNRVSAEIGRVNAELLRQSQEAQRQTDSQNAILDINIAKANAEEATIEAIDAKEATIAVALESRDLIDNTIFKEAFNIDNLYSRNNIVSYNGGSYIAIQDTIGNLPTNEVYWGKLAQRGIDGTGSVSTVNGFSPDLNGNVVVTAEGMGAERVVRKGVANGYAGLDSNAKVPLSQIPDILKQQTYIVLGENERNTLTNLISGDKAYETSTGDSYIYDGSQWQILADADWENVSLEWINIINKPTSSVESIDLSVLNSHVHSNKELLDKFSIVGGKLQHDGKNIGNVDSVNGMTGAVTITSASVGAYSKAEIDTAVISINNNINSKIPNSEKGVAGGVAKLNASGKVVDANGNEVEGKVTSVNGAIGAITGLETTANVDLKIANHASDSITKHVEVLNERPTVFDKRGILFTKKGTEIEVPESTVSADLYRRIDELTAMVGMLNNAIIDGGIFPDRGDIDAGLFTSLDDGEPIDGGTFTSSNYDEEIDGGKF